MIMTIHYSHESPPAILRPDVFPATAHNFCRLLLQWWVIIFATWQSMAHLLFCWGRLELARDIFPCFVVSCDGWNTWMLEQLLPNVISDRKPLHMVIYSMGKSGEVPIMHTETLICLKSLPLLFPSSDNFLAPMANSSPKSLARAWQNRQQSEKVFEIHFLVGNQLYL